MSIEIVTGEQAQTNVASMAANVMLYGLPGLRKTTDAYEAFFKNGRCTAFWISCEDGALKTIAARGYPVPDHPRETVKTWAQMTEVIGWLAQNRGRYTAAVVDSASTLCSYVYKELEQRFAGNRNKFAIPTEMRAALFNLREWFRQIGLHSVFICHAMPPAVLDGVFYPGGPAMTPKTMVDSYFGLIDSVLRVDWLTIPGRAPMRVYYTGGEVWPAELGTFGMPADVRAWRVKNREGCNQMVVPADLGAFLRSRVPPYPGL
jgi:hypothetical protein